MSVFCFCFIYSFTIFVFLCFYCLHVRNKEINQVNCYTATAITKVNQWFMVQQILITKCYQETFNMFLCRWSPSLSHGKLKVTHYTTRNKHCSSIRHTSRLKRPLVMSEEADFQNLLVMANHTHTWWYNMSLFN